MKIKKKNGFTLIELLVVMVILGILTSIGLVSYGSARKQARDTQRRNDLQQTRNALESFSSARGGDVYPSRTICTAADFNSLCSPDLVGFIDGCPADPTNTGNYRYVYCSNGTGGGSLTGTVYILLVKLEASSTNWWEVCSNGKSGALTTVPSPIDSSCDL